MSLSIGQRAGEDFHGKASSEGIERVRMWNLRSHATCALKTCETIIEQVNSSRDLMNNLFLFFARLCLFMDFSIYNDGAQ